MTDPIATFADLAAVIAAHDITPISVNWVDNLATGRPRRRKTGLGYSPVLSPRAGLSPVDILTCLCYDGCGAYFRTLVLT